MRISRAPFQFSVVHISYYFKQLRYFGYCNLCLSCTLLLQKSTFAKFESDRIRLMIRAIYYTFLDKTTINVGKFSQLQNQIMLN